MSAWVGGCCSGRRELIPTLWPGSYFSINACDRTRPALAGNNGRLSSVRTGTTRPGGFGRHEMRRDEARAGKVDKATNKAGESGHGWERTSCLADEGARLAVWPQGGGAGLKGNGRE